MYCRKEDSVPLPEPDEGSPARAGSGVSGRVIFVVHGAEIFDTGEAAWLIAALCPARTIVAGVMARTAAEESGLPVEFNGAPPSRIIRSLNGPVVLGNLAKTPESGRIFGNIIASRLDARGLIQIECSSKTILGWDAVDSDLASEISRLTGYPVVYLSSTHGSQNNERRICGCLPGEQVYVNGTIIGQATGDTVVLRTSGSSIDVVSGLLPKEHGLEKLNSMGKPDLAMAWCKSGPIRLASPSKHSLRSVPASGRVAVIDHCGHRIYDRIMPNCCGVLSIGDDTTAVCGHICAHRGIPVLGIVDGDRDALLPSAFAPGSVVLFAQGERDDDLGKEIALMVGGGPVVWADWITAVLARLGPRVRILLDTRGNPHDAVR